MAANRIYAGTAGGKKYFYGEDGKIFDEAGVEQPPKLAAILKAAFPPPPPPVAVPNPVSGRAPPVSPVVTPITQAGTAVPPSASVPPPVQPVVNNNVQPAPTPDDKPTGRRGGVAGDIASQVGLDLLRIAFPDLYSHGMRYRKVVQLAKKKKKPADKLKKDKVAADKKRNQKELSLKIDTTASHVKTNGELQRQQLTLQTESVTLLEKISRNIHGSNDNIASGIFTKLKSWLLPALGVLGVATAGAGALWLSHKNKEHTDETMYDENVEKYGKLKADELKKVQNESTIERIQRTYQEMPQPDARRPRDRAADRAKKYDKYGRYIGEVPGAANTVPGQIGDTNKETSAIADAAKRKPSGKVIDIKGDTINFEARTIRLDAKTLTINSISSSTGGTASIGAGASAGGGAQASAGGDTQQEPAAPSASDGRTPAGAVNKADITTPNSPGSDNPAAPGFGGIKGGQGATEFGDSKVYDPRATGTAEAIRKNDLTPTQSFRPSNTPGGATTSGSAMPKDLSEDTSAALNSVAAKHGVNPAAIAGVINMESKWDPKAGTGSYHGLTQIGATTFTEAGGRLAGMTYDEFLQASPAKQIEAYGAYLDHYKFADKLKKNGVDISKYPPATQAAILQAMQFAPNSNKWLAKLAEGNKDIPTTNTKQAGALGSTSLSDMEKYFDSTIGKVTDTPGKQQKLTNANAQNTKDLTGGLYMPEMGYKTPLSNWKAMGGIHEAAEKIDHQEDLKGEIQFDKEIVQSKQPFVDETSKVGRGDYDIKPDLGPEGPEPGKVTPGHFNDERKQQQLDSEGGWLWQHGPQGRNRAKQLSVDPWQSEPGWSKPLDSINPVPGEIPAFEQSSIDASEQRASDSLFDEPAEKSEGSHSRITDHVNGAKKPKPIRPIDLDKYYPQYPKSDYTGQSVGIGVA